MTHHAKLPPLILASQSPRRHELLKRIGLPFTIEVRPTDELLDSDMGARELCLYNAREKARVVADEYPGATVIGADTLVFLDDKPLGKPADFDEARQMLSLLSGKVHFVCTAVVVISPLGHIELAEITEVEFKQSSPETIDRYLSLVNVLDKAGSYAVQEHGDLIVNQVTGDMDNVIGLPVAALAKELEKLGYITEM